MPTLFVIRGVDQGSRFELIEPTIRLGRAPSSTIPLHDTEVSRHHAEIRWGDGEYAISDLNSSNGTFINGQRIRHHRVTRPSRCPTGPRFRSNSGARASPSNCCGGNITRPTPKATSAASSASCIGTGPRRWSRCCVRSTRRARNSSWIGLD